MIIRQAGLEDFEAVNDIRKSLALDLSQIDDPAYRAQIQRSGFLLPDELPVTEFAGAVLDYGIAEQDETPIGYIRLSDAQTMQTDTKAFWHRLELEDAYFASPHAYIWGIGVLREVAQRGVATAMLQAAEERVQSRNIPWLFSEIVTEPVTNAASMIFHEKNGFQRVARFEPYRTAEYRDGFQSLLYGKQLS